MAAVLAHVHYMPDHWRGQAHTARVMQEFSQLFQLKAVSVWWGGGGDHWRGQAHTARVMQEFSQLFQLKAVSVGGGGLRGMLELTVMYVI